MELPDSFYQEFQDQDSDSDLSEDAKSSQLNIKPNSDPSTDNNSAISKETSQKKRRRPVKSWVWNYMRKDHLKNITTCDVFVTINNKTQKCNDKFAIGTSTTTLAGHLRTEHRLSETGSLLPLNTIKSSSKNVRIAQKDPTQQTLLDVINNKPPLSATKANRITSRILSWVVDDMQSFNTLSNQKFQDILHETEPRYKFLCLNSFKQKLYHSVNHSEISLSTIIKNTLETFSFTTDLWTEVHKPFIGITAHWLTEDFQLNNALLTIVSFPYPHSAEQLEDYLRHECSKWKITDKCIAGITDSAAVNIKAMHDFGVTHIRCTAHTIQLSILDGLKTTELSELLHKAKSLNSFLTSRDKYRERFRLVQIEIKKQDNPAIREQEIIVLDAISDVSTCWNSTFFLLNRLLDLYPAILALQQDLSHDQDRLIRKDAKTLESLILNDTDLLGIKELVNLLKPFAHATKFMSGNNYPTLSMMLPTICKLQEHLFQIETKLTHPIICTVRDTI
ncbi:7056_t:CDS:1, partial [Cetraspora pellucida]